MSRRSDRGRQGGGNDGGGRDDRSGASVPGKASRTDGLVQRRAQPDASGLAEDGAAQRERALSATALPAMAPPVPGGLGEAFAGWDAAPVQRKGSGADDGHVHEAAARGVEGAGAPLPFLDQIQASFGAHDVTGVAAHTDGKASAASAAIGAQAYATGNHVAFGAAPDLHTAAHEAAHVVQQRGGVHLKGGVGEAGDTYEREADAVADRVVAGQSAEPLLDRYPAHPTGGAAPVQRKPDLPKGQDTIPAGPYVEAIEDAESDGPDAPSAAPIQLKPGDKKREYVPFKIIVSHDMTGEEFKAAANLQVFGVASVKSEWKNVKGAYTTADSPVEIGVEVSLLHRVRGAINAQSGMATDASGKVAGADARAKDFLAQPASDEKTGLLAEIDRRYYARSGASPGTKIKAGEAGNRELWNSIRDEVLFQHQYIANLPDKVKAVIRVSIKGRELTPADYDQLFRVAKKIEALPPGMAADYASKITDTTTDLNTFEAAVDAYRAELAERGKEDKERTTVQNKLLGLEEVYKLYKRYVAMSAVETVSPLTAATNQVVKDLGGKVETASDLKQQLEQQLPRYGFASIAEFKSYIDRFIHAFEEGAVRITLDILGRYGGKLYKEQQRYQDPAVIKDLHGKLGGFRTQQREFETNAGIWNAYAKKANDDHELGRLPGNGHIHAQPPTAEQTAAREKATAAKANAQAQIAGLSKEYPIFAEDELPVDKRLDKTKLAQADESTLGSVILAHIAERQQIVVDARGQLEGKHELIYKMDKLMPTFFAEMDIQPGSIHEEILKDKMHEDAITKIVGGIVLAIVAIALTVVSLGAATPAVIAAGASIGAAGLSTYMAYEEYKEYTAEHALAEAQLAEEPSTLWLVLAIVGAGVDMGAAVKAVKALAPAARALHAGGELADFTKAVKALEESKQLDQKIAQAADRAAAARKSFEAAKGELGAALGKAYSFPGPLVDPEVYRAVVKMAVAKIREGGHSLAGFIAEIKQARIAAKLGDLTPEELTKVKQAWEEAEALAKAPETPAGLADDLTEVVVKGKALDPAHLNPPAPRHKAASVKMKTVAKADNTVIEPGVDVAGDVAAIRSGKVPRVKGQYVVNGRTYGAHDGTLFPISGPGFHYLTRPQFKALGVYNEFGNTARAAEILDKMGIAAVDRAEGLRVFEVIQ